MKYFHKLNIVLKKWLGEPGNNMSIFITKSLYWIHISSSSDMIIHPFKLCLKTVFKSLDHERGNCFLLENLWLMDVISIDIKNFCLFFLSKNLTMLMQGNKNIKK